MWMKIDDRMHSHRKTRAVSKSHPDKRRDIAPMGLWVAAGSWAAQNETDGWVPEDELDRWDDDWRTLAKRLVRSGYWWPAERDGEPGYGFNDWLDYNPESAAASRSGVFGNHVRWHVNKGTVDPECEHCPKEPDSPESLPEDPAESGGDRGAISGPDSGGESREPSGRIAPPPPDPHPHPTQISCASADAEREFDEWYSDYPRKRGRGQALKAYKAARKKVGADVLLARLHQQIPSLTARGPEYVPYPATWLNGERWDDEPDLTKTPFPVNGTEAEKDAWVRAQPLPTDGAYYGGSRR